MPDCEVAGVGVRRAASSTGTSRTTVDVAGVRRTGRRVAGDTGGDAGAASATRAQSVARRSTARAVVASRAAVGGRAWKRHRRHQSRRQWCRRSLLAYRRWPNQSCCYQRSRRHQWRGRRSGSCCSSWCRRQTNRSSPGRRSTRTRGCRQWRHPSCWCQQSSRRSWRRHQWSHQPWCHPSPRRRCRCRRWSTAPPVDSWPVAAARVVAAGATAGRRTAGAAGHRHLHHRYRRHRWSYHSQHQCRSRQRHPYQKQQRRRSRTTVACWWSADCQCRHRALTEDAGTDRRVPSAARAAAAAVGGGTAATAGARTTGAAGAGAAGAARGRPPEPLPAAPLAAPPLPVEAEDEPLPVSPDVVVTARARVAAGRVAAVGRTRRRRRPSRRPPTWSHRRSPCRCRRWRRWPTGVGITAPDVAGAGDRLVPAGGATVRVLLVACCSGSAWRRRRRPDRCSFSPVLPPLALLPPEFTSPDWWSRRQSSVEVEAPPAPPVELLRARRSWCWRKCWRSSRHRSPRGARGALGAGVRASRRAAFDELSTTAVVSPPLPPAPPIAVPPVESAAPRVAVPLWSSRRAERPAAR